MYFGGIVKQLVGGFDDCWQMKMTNYFLMKLPKCDGQAFKLVLHNVIGMLKVVVSTLITKV